MEPSTSFKRMRLRRSDRCAVCDRALAVGVEALWYPSRRVVTCIGCELEGVAVDAGKPGASAMREYERLQKRREDHARENLGRFGVALARVIAGPSTTQAWKKGGEGEIFAGARLEKHLVGSGARLLHDRRVPGAGRGNIDHVAVGGGGVTVIDTKNYRGTVRVERVGGLFSERRTILSINGRDQTKLIAAIETQVALVRSALSAAGEHDVDVRGALCFATVDGLPLLRQQSVREILVDGPKPVANLARRSGDLTAAATTRIWTIIGRAFPPA
jgi:hypothetical protein